MKKKVSLTALFHHDKLMMLVSLVAAIVIWALVVYGPGNIQTREITGVPVSITLNDYASQTLNLRIVDGANATATVRVQGPRSSIGQLSAQDIMVTADTGNVIKEGSYVLNLTAVSSGDYTIKDVIGTDGVSSTVSITCDVWREQAFPIEVEMPNLTVSDAEKYQFGSCSVSGAAITEGQITVAGPKMEINRISRVVATILEAKTISETSVFTAELSAVDESGAPIKTVSFLRAEDAKVSVTVPVMMYRKAALAVSVKNPPAYYKDKADLVTLSPLEVELWGIPSELDEYVSSIQEQLVVDFDTLDSDNLVKEIQLAKAEGVRPVNGSETITLKVNVGKISSQIMEIPLSPKNFTAINCPVGYGVNLSQQKLSVKICGPAAALSRITPDNIRVVVDMKGKMTLGQQEVTARVVVDGIDTVWVCYGESGGADIMVAVVEQSRAAVVPTPSADEEK